MEENRQSWLHTINIIIPPCCVFIIFSIMFLSNGINCMKKLEYITMRQCWGADEDDELINDWRVCGANERKH